MALNKWTPTTNLLMLRRMGKLVEELGELGSVAARCIIQGIDAIDPGSGKVNRLRLENELADVIAQCSVTIKDLKLDSHAITERAVMKQGLMAEWEAMFQPPTSNEPWSPRPGNLIRYDDGSTALALHGEPHAGGWHGIQCMGGSTFYSTALEPSIDDRHTWVQCALRWRNVPLTQAISEAGLSLSAPAHQ